MKQLLKLLLIFLLSFVAAGSSYAQKHGQSLAGQALIDSLLKELPKQKEDTNKVKILYGLSYSYSSINPDEGIKYGQQSLVLAEKLQWKKGVAGANNNLGTNYMNKSDYPKAMEYYLKALKTYGETGDKRGMATAIGNTGTVYYGQGDYPKALEYYFKAVKAEEETGDKDGTARFTMNIGNVYFSQSDYPKTLEYYFKAEKIYEETENKKGIASVTGNIGAVYSRQNDYPKALEFFFKSLKLAEETENKTFATSATGNIGNVYFKQSDYAKALEYDFKALKMDEEIGNKHGVATFTGNIGGVYDKEGKYPDALEYYSKALKMMQEIGDKSFAVLFTSNIGTIYAHQKNYVMAITYCQKALKMNEPTGSKYYAAEAFCFIGDAYLSLVEDTAVAAGKAMGTGDVPYGKYVPDGSIPIGKAARLHLAITYLQRGLDSAKAIHTLDLMQDCYRDLARAYKLTGNYKLAMESYQNYTAIKDSVFSKENDKKLMRTAMQYDYDKTHLADSLKSTEKEKINRLQLQRQRSYTYMGIAGALLLLGFSFFMLRHNKLLGKEKRRSEALLLNILPAEVAEELKTTGASTARHFDNVTVLFTDFVNFTQAGEKLSPQALIDELHTCFKTFDEITARYNIEKIKTIGDAYLAVAGLPVADALHAEHVVRAAIEINNFMEGRYARLGDKTFEVRIGVHSGSVVAGIVGVKKFAYDIWGDTVNTAARMEQNSEAGKINISQTTYDLVKDKLQCEYRGEIDAKNKGMLKMYYASSAVAFSA